MEIQEINIDDAKKKLDDNSAVFVDIRDPDSFKEAHIPGATLLGNDNISEFLSETAKDETVIVYCYHGNSSKMGTDFLQKQGYESVFSMSGGFESWRVQHESEAEES